MIEPEREATMQVMLYDLRDSRHRLVVGWRTWQATLELLHRHDVLGKDELNRLVWRLGGSGTSIGENEARAIADYLGTQRAPGEDVWVDGDIEFDAVTGGTTIFHPISLPWGDRGPARPSRRVRLKSDWLDQLTLFCRTSKGIGAIQEGVT
jgi:hypothetical protein